jgi:hypothetical protein
MDNKSIELKLEGKANFIHAMEIACSSHRKTVGWSIWEEGEKKIRCLVLHWTASSAKNINLLPYEMSVDQVIEFAWGWLEKEPVGHNQPDHDGDNGKGFHMFTHSWGMVNSDYTAFVAIKPIWAMYGK